VAAAVAATVALAVVFGPSLVGYVRSSSDPVTFNNDARIYIVPFFRYTDNGVTGPDTLSDYHLALIPVGFKLLYRTLAPVVDPERLSKVLPLVLFFVTLLATGAAANRLGGGTAAFVALALVLQAGHILDQMAGGLPRAFAFAFVALGLWAVVAGRVRTLAALAVVAMAFYGVAAALLGLMLAALLFLVPRADRGDAQEWSWQRRLAVLVVTAAFMGVLVVPVELAIRPWGRQLNASDMASYPEIGPDGRWSGLMPADRTPFPYLLTEARMEASNTLTGAGPPLVPPVRRLMFGREAVVADVLMVVLVLGLIPLARREGAARRALTLAAAGAVGYALARALSPYLYMSDRYTQYSVPLLIVVLLPACGAALVQHLSPARWTPRLRPIGALLAGGVVLILLGGHGDPLGGLRTAGIDEAPMTLYAFVGSLPKDALVAGWPTGTAIQNVPYLSRRRAFVTSETHQPFHEGFALEMRRRMDVLIEALLGDDPRALVTLRDSFGVTHLIVDTNDFAEAPEYWAPFDAEAARTWQRGKERGFAVERAVTTASVFREGHLMVVDLSKL